MTKTEALCMALAALEIQEYNTGEEKYTQAIKEIKALAQPEHIEDSLTMVAQTSDSVEPEPFTYYRHYDDGLQDWPDKATIPLYTVPPACKWVGLTHEDHMEIMTGNMTASSRIAAVEEKLKEKNA